MDGYKDYNLDVLRAYLESSIRCPLAPEEQRELVRVVLAIAEKIEENEKCSISLSDEVLANFCKGDYRNERNYRK